jgi:hypothetical protein
MVFGPPGQIRAMSSLTLILAWIVKKLMRRGEHGALLTGKEVD